MVRIGLQEKSGHNSLYGQSKNYESVYAVTLSDLIRQLGGDNIFLKMDCEGAEYDILLGTPHEEMAKVSRIAIEIHSDVHPSYKGFDLIWNRLKEFGFSLVDRQPLFAWDVDSLGHKVNYRPLPLTGEIWNR
jgi:ribosomal protein L31